MSQSRVAPLGSARPAAGKASYTSSSAIRGAIASVPAPPVTVSRAVAEAIGTRVAVGVNATSGLGGPKVVPDDSQDASQSIAKLAMTDHALRRHGPFAAGRSR